MTSVRDGLARSLQARLARHARSAGMDPNLVLTRYAVERFLYRLSPFANEECLLDRKNIIKTMGYRYFWFVAGYLP